jgi:metal-responsive CopG/Arc/MetJ family transcriptional regulator
LLVVCLLLFIGGVEQIDKIAKLSTQGGVLEHWQLFQEAIRQYVQEKRTENRSNVVKIAVALTMVTACGHSAQVAVFWSSQAKVKSLTGQ